MPRAAAAMVRGMSEPAVLYESRGHIGVITLNRPDNRNSMTAELLDAFAGAVRTVRADEQLRAVVITGRGRCFSAGADLRADLQRGGAAGRTLQPHERSFAMYEPFLSVGEIDVPVIGALNGHTVGGGFGLALMCDMRVAAAGSKYGANFTRIGLHPGMAISYLLPRLIGLARASELLYTGRLVSGEEAAAMGIVNRAVTAELVWDVAWEMAEAVAANAPVAMRMTKRSILTGLDWRVREAAFAEAYAQARTLETDDCREGMNALLEKREPSFSGS